MSANVCLPDYARARSAHRIYSIERLRNDSPDSRDVGHRRSYRTAGEYLGPSVSMHAC
jgi:hypothetical protein